MKSLRHVVAFFAVLGAVTVLAQTPTPLARSVEVSITNVDVVVTDKKGNPVTDLKLEDFDLKENGVRQALTHLALIDSGAPAAPLSSPLSSSGPAPVTPRLSVSSAAKLHLVVFIDQIHLTTSNRNRALQSLMEFLPKAVGPQVEARVVTWNRALQARSPFTSDGDLLVALLRSLKKETAWGDLPARERDGLFREIDAAVLPDSGPESGPAKISNANARLRAWSDQRAHDIDSTLAAVRSSAGALAGLEGRKVLFFVTEGLSPTPGREVWDYFRSAIMTMNMQGAARGTDMSEMSYQAFDRTDSFKDLTRIANASNVSLVTIDALGLTGDTMFSAEFGRTLFGATDGTSKIDAESALRFLADQTGGSAIIGRNNLGTALTALEPGWRTYYSLGFESANATPGKERSLSVSVKRPGLVVRSRRSLVERTWEQKIADTVLSGLYLKQTRNPLGASLNVGLPVKSGKLYLIPLEFSIPFENLALIPNGKTARGRLILTVAAGTLDGQTSEVSTQRAPIEVPETELENVEGKPFVYTMTLKLKPGPQIVSLALTDEITRLSSYVQPGLMIPDDQKPRVDAKKK
jgi:VWFA-related protein